MTIIDRQIEERSKLTFQYPTDSGAPLYRNLNFLENVEVKETRRTRYNKYNPIGNNGQSFLFTGSDSRSLSLSFNLTLPHMTRYVIVKDTNASAPEQVTIESYNITPDIAGGQGADSLYQNIKQRVLDFDNNFINNSNFSQLFNEIRESSNEDARIRGLTQVMYCVNLIRTSLLTHSKKAYLGPPIVRLKHGILYDNIPCVVENYSIQTDEMAGYDLETFLPNRLKVIMNLTEVRLRGRNFRPKIDGDYVPGWDSVIHDNYSTIDPAGEEGGAL